MFSTMNKTKAELMSGIVGQMREEYEITKRCVKEKLAITAHVLYEDGHESGLAGQLSARGTNQGTYYTQQFGLGFEELSASNFILVNEDLEVLEGSGVPNPANRFHSWIYHVRPDVQCIVHTHALYSAALSMLETPLIVSHNDNCALYDDCAFLAEWPGLPVGNEEGKIIADALGDKRAILLAHHGLLVAATSVEEGCVLARQFERTAKMQILAMSAGEIKPIKPELGREFRRFSDNPRRSQILFEYYARRIQSHYSGIAV